MCLSCLIAQNKIIPPGEIIYLDNECFVNHIFDVDVLGYLIVSPVRHVENISELTTKELTKIITLIKILDFSIKKITKVKKVYICSFGESNKHFLFHLVPRYEGMLNNKEIYTNNQLDGAKLFSFIRYKYKCNEAEVCSKVSLGVNDIRKILNELLKVEALVE